MDRKELPDVRLSDTDADLARKAGSANMGTAREAEVTASIRSARMIATAIHALVESNVALATSNDRHGNAMKWLTAALVFVGLLQVVVLAWVK